MKFEEYRVKTPLYLGRKWTDRTLGTVLTIAGSDSSGGAGIEADLKTITAQGCYGMTCITALTCQTPEKVHSVVEIDEWQVEQVLLNNLESMRCDAVKIGMLTEKAVKALSRHLEKLEMPVVLDPVMAATSGSSLSAERLWSSKEMKSLYGRVSLVTPNIPEAQKLIGEDIEVRSIEDLVELCGKVASKTGCSVLLKGGHSPLDDEVVDVLSYKGNMYVYKSTLLNSVNLHGTGCTLSSCIASKLAQGKSLVEAVAESIQYIHHSIVSGEMLKVTNFEENGPVNHVHSFSRGISRNVSGIENIDFEGVISIPSVSKAWDNYINHDFVKKVSNGTMDLTRFRKYLRQDYNYLRVFGQVHAKLAAESTTDNMYKRATTILENVMHEMGKQEQILGKDIHTTTKSAQMLEYTNYLLEVARFGTWDQLFASTMPCNLGYVFAVRKIEPHITVTEESHPEFYLWLQEYLRQDFYDAAINSIECFNEILSKSDDADTLIKIFEDVCILESKFWDQ